MLLSVTLMSRVNSPHDPLILAGVPSNLADSPSKSANIEGIRQIWRIPSKLTEIVPKSANFGGIMILFLDLSLKTKLGNYKHVLQVLQLSFRSKIVSIVKVNKINYIKTKLMGKLVYRSGWKKTMFKIFMIFSTLKSRAGHNIDLRLIRFGVHKENLI